MTLGFSLPGGGEWLLIFAILIFIIGIPVIAIILYVKNQQLEKQINTLLNEKNYLLNKLSEKR